MGKFKLLAAELGGIESDGLGTFKGGSDDEANKVGTAGSGALLLAFKFWLGVKLGAELAGGAETGLG